ncbi:hypothetical protein OUZ56_010715 [Daphnia magna]|uniref:Uncharacterized protein n=1 Tax=Daphnia magna TaxID=35525 RepID=A0ABQ9YYE1_9CRUS|nr:hypothetical protein OUZ56_010715 [Daphnia magna]
MADHLLVSPLQTSAIRRGGLKKVHLILRRTIAEQRENVLVSGNHSNFVVVIYWAGIGELPSHRIHYWDANQIR